MRGFFYRKIVIILSAGFFLTAENAAGNDVIIKAYSDGGIIIEFTPQQWIVNPEMIKGKLYYKINFENCIFPASFGQPLIPRRAILVAIPFDAQVSFDLLGIEQSKIIDGKPLPSPTLGDDGLAEFNYWEDRTIYEMAQAFPLQLVEISQPMIIRNQQVVLVSFCPVQFFAHRQQIQLYGQILIRLNFIGGKSEQKSQAAGNDDTLTDQLLINPSQAVKWRQAKNLKKQNGFRKTSAGEWYKIWIQEEGIYKISGTDLKAAGIDIGAIQPQRIKVFNNGGIQLPQALYDERPDSLIENTIVVSDEGDGCFDVQDYILFYGKSVNGWEYNREQRSYSHYLHCYTKENVYWLNWQGPDSGKRMIPKAVTPTSPVRMINSFYDHLFIENEYKNLLNSGTTWLGNYFNAVISERSYLFDLPGVSPHNEVMIKVNLAAISGDEQKFSLYFNDAFVAQIPTFYSSSGEFLNITMKQFVTTFPGNVLDSYNRLKVKYSPGSDISLAYMDWIELSVTRQLQAKDDHLLFYSPDSSGFYNYQLQAFSSDDIRIFDITNFHEVNDFALKNAGNGVVEFIDSTFVKLPKRYLAVTPKAYQSPIKIEKDLASDWRNTKNEADFVIICHDDIYDAALALKSLRENSDTLKTTVVKISDVYDEFSWGLIDPTAIRDFIKYAYDHWQTPPRYVLLFGDGDYDYKNIISPRDANWIPPFETSELAELSSRARDDWYVCVAGADNLMDLAIGRIPVRNPDQANDVIKKIIDYENSLAIGEWCNTITMVADDEYGQGGRYDPIDHIPDSDGIAENLIPESYQVNKIYLTEYPKVFDAAVAGIRKPAAAEALKKLIDQGSFIINFIGHGNEQVWTHEHILALDKNLPQLDNARRLAIWIVSTCNFARFDNPNFQSFAEQLITIQEKGAIAVFSACRLAEPFANASLNLALYRFLFNRSKVPLRLGDVIMLAKNSTGNNKNDQLYHLLGDPTLRLAMPQCSIEITNYTPDTMKALNKMEVQGKVQILGEPAPAFNGQLLFKAFDSQKRRDYVVNQWKTYQYKLPGNTIFRGDVSVTDGQFNSRFIIPKDITYGGKEGKFSAFYWRHDLFGAGSLENIIVGGTQTNFNDQDGPEIVIGFDGPDFMPGGFVPPNPVLNITISDSGSGVNIAGDIGHKITMILDHASHETIELNDYFQYQRDSYLAGNISYPLTNLSEGVHHIMVKAWDNCNNSAQSATEFSIVSRDKLVIRDVYNYPNPFSHSTEFTFRVSQDCNVEIKIYTITGRLICQIDNLAAQAGFNHFHWTGQDQDGDGLANGVYLYKVSASCFDGPKKIHVEQLEKCMIMR